MNERRNESPSDYIEKHTGEIVKQNEAEKSLEILSRKIGEVDYQESGSIEIKNQSLFLKLEYDNPPLDVADFNTRILENYPEFMKNFLELKSFKLESFLGKKAVLDLADILPSDYKVFFNPKTNVSISYCSISNKKIFISGDLSSPKNILTLLHEIGHIYDSTKRETSFSQKQSNEEQQEDLAQKLLSERNSWAFAIKTIKPFLSNEENAGAYFSKKDLKNFIKGPRALASHIQGIQQDLLIRKSMRHFNQDFMEDWGPL